MLRHCGKGDHLTRLVLAACRHAVVSLHPRSILISTATGLCKMLPFPVAQKLSRIVFLISLSTEPSSCVSQLQKEKKIILSLALLVEPKGIAVTSDPHLSPPANTPSARYRLPRHLRQQP